LVYLENADRDSIIREDQAEVERYTRRFADLCELTAPTEEFANVVDKIAALRFSDRQ